MDSKEHHTSSLEKQHKGGKTTVFSNRESSFPFLSTEKSLPIVYTESICGMAHCLVAISYKLIQVM